MELKAARPLLRLAPDRPTEPCPLRRHFTASAFVVAAGRVLLLLHARKGLWLPPGGHVEPDESPDRAACREVREETGLDVLIVSARVPSRLPHAAPRPEACLEIPIGPDHTHIDLVYFARPKPGSDTGSLRPNGEADALRWWASAELQGGAADALMARGSLPPEVGTLALRALARLDGPGR